MAREKPQPIYFPFSGIDPEQWDTTYLIPTDREDAPDVLILVDESAGNVEFGELQLPSRFCAVWTLRKPSMRVALELRASANAPLVCERVVFSRVPGGPPITTTSLSLVSLVSDSGRHMALMSNPGMNVAYMSSDGTTAGEPDYGRSAWDAATSPGRGKKLDDALFRKVADVYRAAIASSGGGRIAPTRAVANAIPTSHSNAARYVGLARARGFLEAAPAKGIGGEVQPKPRRKRG